MRGSDTNQTAMFSYLSPEQRVPLDHPLRATRVICDEALRELTGRFAGLYSSLGRSSVPPEKLLRALLLQALYSIRSERLLMEQLQYNLLFRWFVGLNMDETVWVPTVFSKNRERLMRGDVAQVFFEAVLKQARGKDLLSDEHFTVDGTLLEAWASMKSYQKKENPPDKGSGSRGEIRKRDTHESQTDPDAGLYRKSANGEFRLCHMGHLLMENRTGLPVAVRVTKPTPQGEWDAALEMLAAVSRRRATVGADAGYDEKGFVPGVRAMGMTPHVAPHRKRTPVINGRTTRHDGYRISQKKRKQIEQIFGWLKMTGVMRKVRHRGHELVRWMFTLAVSAYSIVRLRNLSVQAG